MKMNPLPRSFYPLLRSMLIFPETPYNILDTAARSMRTHEPVLELTVHDENAHRYLVGTEVLTTSHYERVAESHVILSDSAKITPASFPVIFMAPVVPQNVQDEYQMELKHIKVPDFEAKAKRNIRIRKDSEMITSATLDIDLPSMPVEKDEEAEAKELEKEIQRLSKEEHEKIKLKDYDMSASRNELAYLQKAYKYMAPNGILLFLTHRSLTTIPVLQYLYSGFDNVSFFEVDEDEDNRILIIGSRRRTKEKYDPDSIREWSRYRFGNEHNPMPVLGDTDHKYRIPSVERSVLTTFRVGPITIGEVMSLNDKSRLVGRVVRDELIPPSYEPKTPAPLHKGHLVQLLTSGMIDTYIGEGDEQHLVKGSSVRLANVTIQEGENENEEITTTRDYYTVNLKLLLPDGTFRRII
ncbi:hypothetical protein ACQR3P_29055 [Rhodococcus sp. IEGM1300]